MAKGDVTIVGRMAYVDFFEDAITTVPAKIDTGADISSVWASDIHVAENGVLQFRLFGETSPFYTGKVLSHKHFGVMLVRNSSGHEQIRYSVKMSVAIDTRRVLATFTLSERSKNNFPILIGSKLLKNKFIVDVSKRRTTYKKICDDSRDPKYQGSQYYTKLSHENPKLFYNQYYLNQNGDQS
ncbi:ATP-dependent zinc protease [Pedobacter sp.]|nr:ATP-dependent zinc protease [Candidatus Saccharibacteria bacterium]